MRIRDIGIISFAVIGLAGSATVVQAQSREDNFRAWDRNQDGRLEMGEMQQNQANFNAMDCNKDGYLTLYEFVNRYECNGDQRVATPAPPPVDSRGLNRNGNGNLNRDTNAGRNRGTGRNSNAGDQAFRDLDRNNDGILSRSEWRGQGTNFRDADRNGDGVISRDEYGSVYGDNGAYDGNYASGNGNYGTDRNPVSANDPPSRRFGGYDRNRDGVITIDEYRDSAALRMLDRNGDGVVSAQEYNDRSSLMQTFQSLDRNGDGVLTTREWRTDSGTFSRLDRNRDGVISRDEFLSM